MMADVVVGGIERQSKRYYITSLKRRFWQNKADLARAGIWH
jgi:hypothetical protein